MKLKKLVYFVVIAVFVFSCTATALADTINMMSNIWMECSGGPSQHVSVKSYGGKVSDYSAYAQYMPVRSDPSSYQTMSFHVYDGSTRITSDVVTCSVGGSTFHSYQYYTKNITAGKVLNLTFSIPTTDTSKYSLWQGYISI